MASGAGNRAVTGLLRPGETLAGEREALQQLAAGAPLEMVLETLTRSINQCAPSDLSCSILLLDPRTNRLHHGAAPDLPDAYRRAIDGLLIGPAAGSCGTAAYRREPVIVSDIATDPLWNGYRELALACGLRACWSTPILGSDGRVLGTFAVYYREPRGPRPEEIGMIEFVARTAAIAIERKAGEEERARLLAREREARAEAEAARERIAGILAAMTDGFINIDREFRFTYINPSAELLLGRRLGEVIGKSIWEEYPSIVGTRAEAEYRRAVREQAPVSMEHFYEPLGRWFEANAYPGADGGLSVYFRDITGRKQYEAALRNQQKWLEGVLDLMPTPMLFIEPATARVTFSNRAANEMAGGDFPKGVPAERYAETYVCTDAQGRRIPASEMPGVRLARGERVEGFQMNWRTPGGDRAIIVFGDLLPAMHGHPAIGVLTFQDLTGFKNAEEAVRRAQKLESLGVLAGGVAHDFNNLLTGIMGNASLLAETLSNPDDRVLAQEVIASSERAADLTRQLLAYSGKGRFVMENVNLSQQVREIAALIHTSLPSYARLLTDLDAALPSVWADAGQMQQLVMNLLLNAAEAIGEGRTGTVRVRTALQRVEGGSPFGIDDLPSGLYVLLEVQDDGCGMDEQTMARIFDPFFTTKFTGRGLGLAAVLGIVRGHQGGIGVQSRPGEGTAVRVLLPAVSPAAVSSGTEAAEDLAGAGTVLVVDDEAVVRQTAKASLERFGYTVLLASDGREAVDLYRAIGGRIDVVLLDMTMPVMGGEETLAELQAMRPGIRVVLTSGYSEVEAGRRFFGKGLAGFIQKPYRAAGLALTIKRILA